MLRVNVAVTASAHNLKNIKARRLLRWDVLSISFGILVIAAYLLFYNFVLTRNDDYDIVINGTGFKTEVVSKQADRERGLSGRSSVGTDEAMVFEYGNDGQRCMWMKDMKFSIDMVWLNESRKIVALERNVSPVTYPKPFCHDGTAVIEFAAGTADRVPFGIGDEVQ